MLGIKTILLTFGLLLFSNGLFAELTSKGLVEDCKTKLATPEKQANNTLNEAFQMGACSGYLKGLDDMHILYAAVIAKYANNKEVSKFFLYCLPEGSTNTQLAKVVVNYLEKHPDDANEPASISVVKAFRDIYPCKMKPAGEDKSRQATVKTD